MFDTLGMMARRSSDVPSTNAGFAYQFVRALYWLADADLDQYVSVEHIDDTALLDSTKKPLKADQAKFTAKHTSAVTDRSVALWKTLSNWTRSATIFGISHFIISTNRAPSPTHIVQRMSRASSPSEVNACAESLQKMAGSPVDALAPFMAQVTAAQPEILQNIIKNFELVVAEPEGSYTGSDIYTSIINKLCPPSHIDRNKLLDALIGWVNLTLLSQWNRGEQGIISKMAFTTQYHRLVSSPSIDPSKTRPWHEIVNSIPSKEISRAKDELFVRQMREIELTDDEIYDGIQCYYGASLERIRLTQEGELTHDDIRTHNYKCHSRWRKEFRKQQTRLAIPTTERGRDLYYAITSHTPQTDIPFDPNIIEGIYHRLANNEETSLFLGWHPDYATIFKKVTDA